MRGKRPVKTKIVSIRMRKKNVKKSKKIFSKPRSTKVTVRKIGKKIDVLQVKSSTNILYDILPQYSDHENVSQNYFHDMSTGRYHENFCKLRFHENDTVVGMFILSIGDGIPNVYEVRPGVYNLLSVAGRYLGWSFRADKLINFSRLVFEDFEDCHKYIFNIIQRHNEYLLIPKEISEILKKY